MSKILTAREMWANARKNDPNGENANPDPFKMMIEFAKMHVKEALINANDKAKIKDTYNGVILNGIRYSVEKESILSAYPIENIK